jgi:prepilin-type N-terminal cleavage/methylation domain-containing protein/prepilin-type processing-associated H-X9-DG protein
VAEWAQRDQSDRLDQAYFYLQTPPELGKLCSASDFAYGKRPVDDTVRFFGNLSMKNSLRAFTLIELLVVITIIAILVSIALPVFSSVQEKARVTQDLNNLRQIGIATQTYLNDHDSILFDPASGTWMTLLHGKYLPAWKIFQSPFDGRNALEDNTTAPISYGINANGVGMSTDKIRKATQFILLAPAQTNSTVVKFAGTAGYQGPGAGVTVLKAVSSPGATAKGGTHNKRTRINALFGDLHVENLTWATFIADPSGSTDDPSYYRWDP